MNAKQFSEAMGELDNKYIDKAIYYQQQRKKRNWVKWGVLAACLSLLTVVVINIGRFLSGTSGCGHIGHNITIEDDNMYFSCNSDGVYLYRRDNATKEKIADFDGVLTKTSSGLYLLDETTGRLYTVSGNTVTEIGNIEPDSIFIDVIFNKIYYWSHNDDAGYRVMEKNPATGEAAGVPVVSRDPVSVHKIIDGKLYYDGYDDGYLTISMLDMETGDNQVIYKALAAREIINTFFYDGFILIEAEEGLFAMGYGDTEAVFLTEYLPITGALDCFDNKLYFVIAISADREDREVLISFDLDTKEISEVTQLTERNETARTYTEIAVCDTGYYYTDPSADTGGLFYHSFDDKSEIQVCKNKR